MDFKFLKLKKNFDKKDYKVNFDLYWHIVLAMFFVMIVVSFFYGLSIFTEINKDNASYGTEKVNQVEQKRKDKIEKVLKYFSDREQKSNVIINSPSPVVDPSL